MDINASQKTQNFGDLMKDESYDEDNATVILITFALDTIDALKPEQLTPYHYKVIAAAKVSWKAEVSRTLENLERYKEKIKTAEQNCASEILLAEIGETIKTLRDGIEELENEYEKNF